MHTAVQAKKLHANLFKDPIKPNYINVVQNVKHTERAKAPRMKHSKPPI